jgi:uncharacterized protein YbjT (DUF2867 family)
MMRPMARRDRCRSEPRHQAVNGSALMKIAILSAKDVADWYAATLMQRGHLVTIGYLGHPPTAVAMLMKDGVDGVLILSDDDDAFEEVAARFTKATGRPVWRNLTDIPQ